MQSSVNIFRKQSSRALLQIAFQSKRIPAAKRVIAKRSLPLF